ncbi:MULTISPECIES: MFS transporter [unclassified Peribacillus]|uniref:MFS transporter n=1 Tax=unclassified Peribacillus TaxID=2675266 RepID=UPI001914C057|nr:MULTISPECIES: MFS transporter [unclassified Peribacillus]MBK5441539.1 MFS transporter [Peribacillus sp. TH24]MBK5458529.1 MFS transporter [Peribacillus sp. TH27]WMX58133.1 MFS transporter [Peribacillus sp. R9-11]
MNKIVKKAWNYRYVVLVVLWLVYIINYFDRMAVLTFLPFIQEDLNLTPVEVGQLASVFFFAYAAAQISAGYLADKIGPKKVMYIAILVFTVITALTGAVKNFTQFLLLRIGLGFGEGHHFAPAIRAINNWFPQNEKGRATSFFATSWAVAPAIVPVIVTSISFYFFGGDWRPVFYVLAIPGAVAIFLLWYFVSNTPKEMIAKGRISKEQDIDGQDDSPIEKMSKEEKRKTYGLFLKDFHFYVYTLLLFCQLAVYWGTTTWLTSFLVTQHGMNIKEMGFFGSAPYIIAFFAMLLGGWLMDKVLGRMKPVALIGGIGSIPVLWMLGAIDSGKPALLLTLLLLVGFFVNLNFGSIYAFLPKRYPKEIVGSATGLSNGIGQLGAFVSPLVAGYLVTVGADGSQDFGNVFIFFASVAALSVVCAIILKEKPVSDSVIPTVNQEKVI